MAEVIICCPEHPKFTCCIVKIDGQHVPGRACTCDVVDGQFVPHRECPVDQHQYMWLVRNQEW